MSSKYDGHQIAEIKKSMMLAGISTSDIERAINHLIGPIFKFNDSEVRVCDHGGSYYPTFEGKGYGMRPLRLDEMSSQAQDLFDCVKGFSYTKKNGPDRGDCLTTWSKQVELAKAVQAFKEHHQTELVNEVD